MSQILKFLAVCAGALVLATKALALQSGPFSASFPLSGTQNLDFTNNMSLPKFDSSLGTLQSISFTISGNLTASQKFENLSGGSSTTIIMTSQGTMTLRRPDGTSLVVTIPQVQNSRGATAFDGTIDFTGGSGFIFPDASGSNSSSATLNGASDLALFTGTGSILLPVTAVGNSNGTGSANLLQQYGLVGASSASVTYTYTTAAPVPEASTYGAIGMVVAVGVIGYRRSRKAVKA